MFIKNEFGEIKQIQPATTKAMIELFADIPLSAEFYVVDSVKEFVRLHQEGIIVYSNYIDGFVNRKQYKFYYEDIEEDWLPVFN